MKKYKEINDYRVEVPFKGVYVYLVKATSKKEAKEIARSISSPLDNMNCCDEKAFLWSRSKAFKEI